MKERRCGKCGIEHFDKSSVLNYLTEYLNNKTKK